MYQPSTECVDKEGRLEAASWTKTLVPGGARGVALNSKFSLMDAWAKKAWIFAGILEEIEIDHSLGNETIPVL